MNVNRDRVKVENGMTSDYDPLDESVIDGQHETGETVAKKRRLKRIDEDGEDVGWTHEYGETIVRELKNFPCLWDRKLESFSKRSVCDPARKHIVFMLKQNHPNASSEIHEKLFTPQSVGRKIRNLRLAYKKIWHRDGAKAKWRHYRNLSFLQTSSANLSTNIDSHNDTAEMIDQDLHYDDSYYDPPFGSNDESTQNKSERHFSPVRSKSPEMVERTTQQCRCHPTLKFAQSVMDQLSVDDRKKFTIDLTKILLKYQENNLL